MKIAFIGEITVFQPFAALGQEVYAAADEATAEKVLSGLDLKEYALVVLTPGVAGVQKKFSDTDFLVLPGIKHRDSGQQKFLADIIRKATGRVA